MISVPDAALLPMTLRPISDSNSSTISAGNPCGNVRNGRSVMRDPDIEEKRDQRNAHHPQPLVQLEHADERADQRETEQRPTRRRQPGGERDEEEPASHEEPAVPGQPAEDRGVDAAREVVVGLACVAGEQPLEVVRCQVFGVGVPELTRAVAGWHLLHL